MKETIECMYTCAGCGLVDRKFQVPARGEEDVIMWMEQVFNPALGRDHANRSPHCTATKTTNVKIKIGNTKDAKIGGPVQRKDQ